MLPKNTLNYYCIHDSFTVSHYYFFAFMTIVTLTRKYVMYMSKMDASQILGSLGGYTTESFSCNYFVFDPISSGKVYIEVERSMRRDLNFCIVML